MNLAWVDEIGNRQDGLITRRQARMVLTDIQIERLLIAGIWRTYYDSVYLISGTPRTWLQSIRAATLSHEGPILVSNEAAARLHKVWVGDTPPEFIVPYGNYVRLENVKCHRSRLFDLITTTKIAGIDVTSPARTLVDIAGKRSEKTLKKVTDLMITRHIVTPEEILIELGNSGRRARGRNRLASIVGLRDQLTAECDSEFEAWALEIIRVHNIPDPIPQYWLRINGKPRRIDFAYPELKIAIELQSWTYHAGPSQFEDDQDKISGLTEMGWKVIPITRKMPEARVASRIRNTILCA